jgi:hypothetical protein
MHAGSAARAGVEAAELARLGLTGPTTIFEGPPRHFRPNIDATAVRVDDPVPPGEPCPRPRGGAADDALHVPASRAATRGQADVPVTAGSSNPLRAKLVGWSTRLRRPGG